MRLATGADPNFQDLVVAETRAFLRRVPATVSRWLRQGGVQRASFVWALRKGDRRSRVSPRRSLLY